MHNFEMSFDEYLQELANWKYLMYTLYGFHNADVLKSKDDKNNVSLAQ